SSWLCVVCVYGCVCVCACAGTRALAQDHLYTGCSENTLKDHGNRKGLALTHTNCNTHTHTHTHTHTLTVTHTHTHKHTVIEGHRAASFHLCSFSLLCTLKCFLSGKQSWP